jgi:hypothetical protein
VRSQKLQAPSIGITARIKRAQDLDAIKRRPNPVRALALASCAAQNPDPIS